MESDVVRYSRQSDGLGVVLGSLWWPRPYYPTRVERAALVAQALPRWAVASGGTAAWVWSGFGYAEPWCVLRHQTPAISPLDRTRWAALTLNPTHHAVENLSGLTLLGVRDTVREVLLGAGDIDAAAAQVWALTNDDHQSLWNLCRQKRANNLQRHHAEKVLRRVDQLRSRYPDITL
jgi:hypothetical protein